MTGCGDNPSDRHESADELVYATPADGMRKLADCYDYWTEKVGNLSFQISIALIGANWAVFSNNVSDNILSIISIFLALGVLVASMVYAGKLANLHHQAFYSAQRDRRKWKDAWERSESFDSQWPFNETIVQAGRTFQNLRIWLSISSGISLVAAVLCSWIQ